MNDEYRTAGGVVVRREVRAVDAGPAVEALIDRLDAHRGVLLSSSYEYPGRYTRWDLGFADPLLYSTLGFGAVALLLALGGKRLPKVIDILLSVIVVAAEGDSDFDVGGVRETVDAARAVYRLHGAEAALQEHYPPGPHAFPEEDRKWAYERLDAAMK